VVATSPHGPCIKRVTNLVAFVNSPFELLDANGSLSLVTDAVHEDFALCLAPACVRCATRSGPRLR
jgi:hypothetical protein